MDSSLPTQVSSNVSHISRSILTLSLNSVLNISVSTSNGPALCIAVIGEGSAQNLSVLVKCQHCEHRQVQMDTTYSNVCFFPYRQSLLFFLVSTFPFPPLLALSVTFPFSNSSNSPRTSSIFSFTFLPVLPVFPFLLSSPGPTSPAHFWHFLRLQ